VQDFGRGGGKKGGSSENALDCAEVNHYIFLQILFYPLFTRQLTMFTDHERVLARQCFLQLLRDWVAARKAQQSGAKTCFVSHHAIQQLRKCGYDPVISCFLDFDEMPLEAEPIQGDWVAEIEPTVVAQRGIEWLRACWNRALGQLASRPRMPRCDEDEPIQFQERVALVFSRFVDQENKLKIKRYDMRPYAVVLYQDTATFYVTRTDGGKYGKLTYRGVKLNCCRRNWRKRRADTKQNCCLNNALLNHFLQEAFITYEQLEELRQQGSRKRRIHGERAAREETYRERTEHSGDDEGYAECRRMRGKTIPMNSDGSDEAREESLDRSTSIERRKSLRQTIYGFETMLRNATGAKGRFFHSSWKRSRRGKKDAPGEGEWHPLIRFLVVASKDD
jgi:hypothetical protein